MGESSLEPNPTGSTSYFKTRTASVSLKIDIHPPLGININHVEGESSHSTVIKQGEEILHFTVYSELKEHGLTIPKDSLLFQGLLCTSKGFLLLRWESLCKTIYEFMKNNQPTVSLTHYINQRCHCARRLRPMGCNGFLCLALGQISKDESFSKKITKLLYYTVCASRWSLQTQQPTLLDKILRDSLSAMDIICAEHDLTCLGGWSCVVPLATRKPASRPHIMGTSSQPLILVVTAASILIGALVIHKLFTYKNS